MVVHVLLMICKWSVMPNVLFCLKFILVCLMVGVFEEHHGLLESSILIFYSCCSQKSHRSSTKVDNEQPLNLKLIRFLANNFHIKDPNMSLDFFFTYALMILLMD